MNSTGTTGNECHFEFTQPVTDSGDLQSQDHGRRGGVAPHSGRSLVLTFDTILGRYVGTMPIFDDYPSETIGIYW
jgi:hypothetical protein